MTHLDKPQFSASTRSAFWPWLIGAALVIGIGFRLWHIDYKIYWFDEVYTTLRASGYMGADIEQAIFQDKPLVAPELKLYQQLKPGSTVFDTLRSLAIEDPQHPPFYFLLARIWMQGFGSSILASRALAVLISLLSLPLMYLLALELFSRRSVAWFAATLLAVSPVDILFAQTARQYSLLTLSVIGSSWLLLRALRLNHTRDWFYYGLAMALGLYGHVFFILNWVSQGLFMAWPRCAKRIAGGFSETGTDSARVSVLALPRPLWPLRLRFGLASGLGLLLYGPWIVVLITQRDRGLTTTSWANGWVDALTYLKFWVLGFTSTVVDSNGSIDDLLMYLPRLPVLALFGYGFWRVIKTGNRQQKTFILTAGLGPFLLLAGLDLWLVTHRSIVTRYLLGAFPAVQLASAYGLAALVSQWQRLAQLVWVAILVGSFTSCWLSARADTWWVKAGSFENGLVASYINGATSPLVVTDQGDNDLNQGNLLSLGYRFDPGVMLLPVSSPPQPSRFMGSIATHDGDLLAYAPSQDLLQVLISKGLQPQRSEVPGVWTLTQPH